MSDTCGCGRPLGDWHSDERLFRVVMGDSSEAICIGCFAAKANAQGTSLIVIDMAMTEAAT